MKGSTVILLLCFALGLASCSGPSISAVGESDDLVIVVDGELRGSTGLLAKQTFSAKFSRVSPA